ncbi:3-keto-disaccharide hydrolase [Reichenbachiella ulvae]|uniref:DUF1080 domain-containing protein n=1 Tax=Reichenbachiella ulvae TaxID=2980104 RepID=A0ABT3CSS6_9BACT|nr:DUF1080 domain-containing protein [Reichenbachiella ulvae]MCV9386662.1 DUF1080 domain-containing protein [Reichenbachiella ulvae]
MGKHKNVINSAAYSSLLLMIWGLVLGCTSSELDQRQRSFVKIFDGRSLDGWKGDSTYWRVENGNLVGEVTPETILEANSFVIWQGGQPEDFELMLEYRISESGNSGVNYRSNYFNDKPFALQGYQCDIDGKKRYVGQNYEEKKRTTLAYMGEKVKIGNWNKPDSTQNLRSNVTKNCWQTRQVLSKVLAPDSLKSLIKDNDWNTLRIFAKDNLLQHYVNGVLMSEVLDKDTLNRSTKGFIGMQVHVGPPMKVEFRNISLKNLID